MQKIYNENNLCVLEMVAKDDFKPVLNGVRFSADGRVTGADGLILAETTVQKFESDEEIVDIDKDIIVSKKDMENFKLTNFKEFPTRDKTFVIEPIANDRVQLKTLGDDTGAVNKRETKGVDGAYPEYEKLFEQSADEVRAVIRVDAKLLNKMAKAVVKFKGKDCSTDVYISVRGDAQAVIFTTKNSKEQEFRGLVMPMIK